MLSHRTAAAKAASVWDLYRRSDAARAILDRRSAIEARLRVEKRKVWPVARVARLFDISARLLWMWISKGCIRPYRQPTKNHRPGISAKAIRALLNQLEGAASHSPQYTNSRRRMAEEKCRATANSMERGEELTPKRFAARARVSQTTVHRLIGSGLLYARRPTPHRKRICHPSEQFKKKRLTGKERKRRL